MGRFTVTVTPRSESEHEHGALCECKCQVCAEPDVGAPRSEHEPLLARGRVAQGTGERAQDAATRRLSPLSGS